MSRASHLAFILFLAALAVMALASGDLLAAARVPVGFDHGLPDGWRSGASPPLPFFPGASYDQSIPSPESVLGFPLGAHPVRHAEVVTYLEALADATSRLRLISYGTTHEGRTLLAALVTGESNMERLALTKLLEELPVFRSRSRTGRQRLESGCPPRSIRSTP